MYNVHSVDILPLFFQDGFCLLVDLTFPSCQRTRIPCSSSPIPRSRLTPCTNINVRPSFYTTSPHVVERDLGPDLKIAGLQNPVVQSEVCGQDLSLTTCFSQTWKTVQIFFC